MSLSGFLGDSAASFSSMPEWFFLASKVTILLAVAWLMHFALAWANPRWRMFLWRGVAVSLAILPFWMVLPGWEIRVAAPRPVVVASALGTVYSASEQPMEAPIAVKMKATDSPRPVEVPAQTARTKDFAWSLLSWQIVLLNIWGIGVALLALRLSIAYVRLVSLMRDSRPAPEAVVVEARRIATALGCRRAVQIRVSRRFTVPFLYGLLRPVVVLPERMCGDCPNFRFNENGTVPFNTPQLSGILAHELAHTRSCDLMWNAGLQFMSIALWFHPLAWRMASVHRTACDAVCDAVSASYLGDVQEYCRTLARVAIEATGTFASVGLTMARSCDVRRRLAVLQWKVFALPLRRRAVVGAAIIGLSVLTLVAGLKFVLAEQLQPNQKTSNPTAAAENDSVSKAKPVAEETTQNQTTSANAGVEDAIEKTIRGKVLDEQGKAVADAEVWLSVYCKPPLNKPPLSKPRVQYTKSDSQGWFTLEIPPAWVEQMEPGTPTSLWAYAAGYQLGINPGERFSFKGNVSDLAIRLKPATDTSFIVLDPEGQPLTGALVQPYYVTHEPTPDEVLRRIEARTDAEGRAKFPAIGREMLNDVRVNTKDFGIQDHRYSELERPLPAEHTIHLRPVGRIEGQVIADKPEWVRGVRMIFNTEMLGDPAHQWFTPGFADVESDEQGRFVVPAIAVGRIFFHTVLVDENLPVRPKLPIFTDPRARRPQFINVQAGETTVLNIPMMPLVPVRGNVRVKDTGEPVAGMKISIRYGGGGQRAEVVSDAQGRFTARVLPGSGHLDAMNLDKKYAQLGDKTSRPYEVPEQTEEFELPPLEVVRVKGIAGRVIDEHDRPVADAVICIDEGNRRYGFGESDAKGQFNLTGVPEMIDIAKAKYEIFLHENATERRMFGSIIESNPLLLRVQTGSNVDDRTISLPPSRSALAQSPTTESKPQAPTEEISVTPGKVFEEVLNTYKAMDTYKAEGTVGIDMDTGATKTNIETSFSIALKKPNLYLISWTQKNKIMPNMAQSGAVWSDGVQPYLYMGAMHAYSKISGDEIALGGATGISGGAASIIPSLFLKQQSPFILLKDPKIEGIEKIEGEDCYVISGPSTISTKETWWISKSKHIIVKYSRSLTPPEGGMKTPELTDEQLEASIKGMGMEVTEERKKNMKEMMARSRDLLKNMKMSGTSTEIHVKISSPAMSKDDFHFTPPKDAELKESLFSGILGGGAWNTLTLIPGQQPPSAQTPTIEKQPAAPDSSAAMPPVAKSSSDRKTETKSDEKVSLPTLEECTCRDALEAKIKKARQTNENFEGAHIVVGRIVLDTPERNFASQQGTAGDETGGSSALTQKTLQTLSKAQGNVRDVAAQMEILPDGYFAGETKDLDRPIGFRLHRYAPLNAELKGHSGEIVDLGTLHLVPLPASKLVNLTGQLTLEGQEDVSKASVKLSILSGPVNTPHYGISPRPHWPDPIRADIGADGRISASGFSPDTYMCMVEAPGYIKKSFKAPFKEGETYDLGTINLEKPKQIELTYIVAEKPPFDATKKKKTNFLGGTTWKATNDTPGWDLAFSQDRGDIILNHSYSPCYFKDLGDGDMIDYLDSTIDTESEEGPNREKAQSGHVYLLHQECWKRWILFKVKIK